MKTIGCGCLMLCALFASAQEKQPQSAPSQTTQEKQAIPQKPRIFIGESNSWEIRGGGGGYSSSSAKGAGAGAAWIYAAKGSSSSWNYMAGGARPQTAELVKTFGERCDGVVVNRNPTVADFAVLFDHEGGKGVILRHNKIAVFNRAGDAVFSHSTRSLGNSVKDACSAILADWQAHGQRATDPPSQTVASDKSAPENHGQRATDPPSQTVASDKSAPENQGPGGENQIPALGIVAATWERGGAEIIEIEPGTVAEAAYLHVGDVITSFNGRPVKNSAQLASELSKRGKGSQVRLGYLYRSISSGYVPKETLVILGGNL